MKLFQKHTTQGLEEQGDRLGGGSNLFESGLYTGTVKLAYAGQASASQAQSVTVHIEISDGGKTREFRETYWITNRDGENFYPDKRDPTKRQPLPGYTMVDELCLVTTGMALADQDTEDKVVKLYDFEAKKDLPKTVPVLTDLLGKEVIVAVVKETVDKTAKNGSGEYVPTGETRDQNIADKFFHAESRMTVAEARANADEAVFIGRWEEKNKGQTRNRVKGTGGKAGAPGGAAGQVGGGKSSGLFGGTQGGSAGAAPKASSGLFSRAS